MLAITSKQRAYLRSLAHGLEPVVHVGVGGVTGAVLASVRDALRTRELIKLRVLESAPEPAREVADEVAASLDDLAVVQTIGRVAVLYRPFPEEPEIRLPARGG